MGEGESGKRKPAFIFPNERAQYGEAIFPLPAQILSDKKSALMSGFCFGDLGTDDGS